MRIHTRTRTVGAVVVMAAVGASSPARATAQEGSVAGGLDVPSAADTLVLTLERAEAEALRRSPGLAAERQARGVAEGRLRQAGTYRFNPTVEFEVKTLDPAPGADAFDRYEGVVAQEIEWAGQWGLRRDAAGSGVRAASASVEDSERAALLGVRAAFHRAVAADRVLEVSAEIAALADRLRSTALAELDAGEVSLLDANLTEIEYGRSRARFLRAERDRASALLELKRVAGIGPETAVRVVSPAVMGEPLPDGAGGPAEALPDPAALDVDSLVAVAVGRRPDLRRAEADIARAGDLERLARREAIPNLRLAAPIERGGPGQSARVGVGLGLAVPLWNRNRGTADARRAELIRARFERDQVELEVRTEVADAVQRYRSASEAAFALQASVLGPAATNLDLVEESYREGKIDLTTLLVLQNQLLDARTEYWAAWLDRRVAWARVRAAVGERGSDPNTDRQTAGAQR